MKYKIPFRSRTLLFLATGLVIFICLTALIVNFKVASLMLSGLLVALIVVRWAQPPISLTFAAKNRFFDTLVLSSFALGIVVLSIIAPG